MIYQGQHYEFDDFKNFLHYWIARFGPFYNFFGWSPTWEWMDIWKPGQLNQIMLFAHRLNPFPTLLSAHDCSHSRFSNWLSFSMRQAQSNTIFDGNSRIAGKKQRWCDGNGGIGAPFLDLPIIGSEDIWEFKSGILGFPRNAQEVRRGAWGVMMSGVLPIYSEWVDGAGKGEGEPEIRRMFDFFYSKTKYRQYMQLNTLVPGSEGQICSGIPGNEYLIYDINGGVINMDLSWLNVKDELSVLWFNPGNGVEMKAYSTKGGATRSLRSPFEGDSVLLLKLLTG
jgi:hypothetical protein